MAMIAIQVIMQFASDPFFKRFLVSQYKLHVDRLLSKMTCIDNYYQSYSSQYYLSIYFNLSSVIPTDKEYLSLNEENLTPAEMRHISWTQYGEEGTYKEIE